MPPHADSTGSRTKPLSTLTRRLLATAATITVFATALPAAAVADQAPAPLTTAAQHVADAYPSVGPGTHFLDDASYLSGFNDPAWYESNIPFVDLPDATLQNVYYYRWRDWKEHLTYTDPTDGWISTEFLDCCGYSAPYQAIDAAAGHQITEGRWVRNQSYDDDYIRFWLTGPGAGPKPATDSVNADTTDWAHEYSMWLATAAYGQAEETGDFSQVKALLPDLVRQYRGWDKQFDAQLGLYWSVPVWDAMEYSASSYASSDPYHGGAGYRPTLNSYQYGDASAISAIANMVGDHTLAAEYARRAADLKAAMQKWLWDPSRGFYYTMARDDNPNHKLSDTREEIGYIPWMFGAATPSDATAWSQLLDPQGFASAYGPTTAERRSPWFMYQAGGCCRWDGPSWPFATSQTLTGLANLLDDYPSQSTISASDYDNALETYAQTQTRNGQPYVAEAHDPDQNQWLYDSYDHSEDYNHSTFDDLVLSGLLGLRPQAGDDLRVQPLVPTGWNYFAAENVPYHGHNVTVLWDRDGTHYKQGAGLRIYVDGRLVRTSPTLQDMTVDVGPTVTSPQSPLVDDAANPLRQGYPKPIASYTWRNDDPWNGIDGKVWFNEVPEDTRWTNYDSPNSADYYGVDFGAPTAVSDISWYGYDDGGGVRPAAAYRLQYWDGTAWRDVPDQTRNSTVPVGNGLNRITFPPITTTQVRLLFTDPPGAYVGVTEFESWAPSSRDASVTLGPANQNGLITVDTATPVDVTVHNNTDHPLDATSVSLGLPPGWTAAPSTRATASVAPGRSAVWRFAISHPAAAAPGTPAALTATATYREAHGVSRTTHTLQNLQVAYPPGQTDPIGTWTFDEGSGSVAHDSSGTNDLQLIGDPAWVPGVSGTALQFDGSSQYGQTSGPVLDTTGNFSVAAWVRLDRTGSFATAVSQDGATTSGFFLQYSAADNRFAFSTGEGRALADQPPTTGQWYQLVGVHDANTGTYTLYLDGKPQSTVWNQSTGDSASGPLAIGRAFSGGHDSDFWPGSIDQVHVWNRALTAADVSGLYSSGT
ncbi:MGH1-like glycoside hydrolase domain-containing protein [Streptacidiphilus fuscans]|uniref:Discoidin domain-containing protein n=1 Tax=Streptacidiphilus fuscans TaxID=2789292 RepID=A0A931FC97_9ACTN|nr:LamG-like jellyroll fold domain-containing protein [Streptacidiphilus fuscans]MBF9066950.1 discoidin domain-containing protein [Streptacidiphilus fuscans]